MTSEFVTCLKQVVECRIEVRTLTGEIAWEGMATNGCRVDGLSECPRVTEGCASGEGYDLCGPPRHAEDMAVAKMLSEFGPIGVGHIATAFIRGHTYLCMDCQHALTKAGIRTFVVTGLPSGVRIFIGERLT